MELAAGSTAVVADHIVVVAQIAAQLIRLACVFSSSHHRY